jgi:FkbH-like protein
MDNTMKSFSELKKNLKNDVSQLTSIKIAVLGDTATQFIVQALKGEGIDHNINLQIWEAEFNQIERQVLDTSSELYEYSPEFVLIFKSSHKLLLKYNKLDLSNLAKLADREMASIKDLVANIHNSISAKVIYFNYAEIDDSVFGNYASKTESSFLFQLRKLNYELMSFATTNTNINIVDLSSVQNTIGKLKFTQSSIYINSEMIVSIDALPFVAQRAVTLIAAQKGKINKCIILDLDNTAWGGIIGDDGMENIQIGSLGIGKAFSEFQYWVKKLKNRGIIVCICSKNTESVAKEPFEKHPDMVLRLEDISVFIANWENKADNIRHIQSILNIGFDSMVFLDDNPFERSMVRENIPGITVPELPEDPANYLEYLYGLNLFETASISNEDLERTKLYQTESARVQMHSSFTNEDDFLENLEMRSTIQAFNKFNFPRISQLSQRSNQFNLRTIRYTEDDIKRIAESDKYFTFSFTLDDRFGENGLICVIILEKLDDNTIFIDTWFMSCRVLKRGMEYFVLDYLVSFAKEKGFSTLKGEYLPTQKNEIVKNHYKAMGFELQGSVYFLDVLNYQMKANHIKRKIIDDG